MEWANLSVDGSSFFHLHKGAERLGGLAPLVTVNPASETKKCEIQV